MDEESAMQQPTRRESPAERTSPGNLYVEHPVFLMNLKLTPPELPAVCIERPALLANIELAAAKKLTVLAAPTGSGKSVLLGQWQRRAAVSRAIAWLSLDAQDDQPMRFFAYLVGAIGKALPDCDLRTGAEVLQTGASVDVVATWLAETLCCITQPVSIAIDDFQHLHDPDLARAFAFVVHRSPVHVRWILCGRSLPELACSELKPRDDVCIIDRQSLGFACTEIVSLSRELRSTPLSPEQAEAIRLRTEGWVTGVKLLLLSDVEPANGEATRPVCEPDLEIARYLEATVLRQQPPQVRQLLIISSILEHLNEDLCNALPGVAPGVFGLETLERAQLFIQPLDGRPGWYRYNRVFRELLRRSLQHEHAERVPALHLAASRWFAAQQMHEDALHHAFRSEEPTWCAQLVARCARLWLRNGEISALMHWTRRLSREQIVHHEALAISYITCLIMCRRFAEAGAWLDEVETAAAQGTEAPWLRAYARTLRLMLAVLANGVTDIDLAGIDLVLPASLLEQRGRYLAGTLMTLQAYGLLRRCRFDEARRLALRARNAMLEHNDHYAAGHADMLICLADCAQGDMQLAAEICERMFAEVRHDQHSQAWANAAAVMARMRYEQNQLPEAEALCLQAMPVLSIASTPEMFTVAHILLARLHASAGRRSESLRVLDSLHSVLEGTGDDSWLGHVCYEKVCLHLANGERQRAASTAADFGLPELVAQGAWQQPRDYDARWERFGMVQAMLLLDAESFDQCRSLLNVLARSAYAAGFVYRAAPLEALLAVCSWRAGSHAAAFAAVNRGLALMPKFGFIRSMFDEAPGLQEVISAAVRSRQLRHALPAGYLDRFADLFANQAAPSRPTPARPAAPQLLEPLTERELEVLQLLAQGLSNPQISSSLAISLATVKWHLRNVFAKLDVPTRTGALARARELNILTWDALGEGLHPLPAARRGQAPT